MKPDLACRIFNFTAEPLIISSLGWPVLTSQYVSMKGTRRGILVSISEECPFDDGLDELRARVAEKGSFFAGSPVSLDLGWRDLRDEHYERLMQTVRDCSLQLLGVISSSHATRKLLEKHGIKCIIGTLGLAKHGGNARVKATATARAEAAAAEAAAAPPETADAATADTVEVAPTTEAHAAEGAVPVEKALSAADADPTLMVRKTLRSGQRIQFAGNVVVMGDVNAGAEIEAEGDVIVLGNLRGIVHAGSKGKRDAVVLALNLHAAQVRVGNLIGLVTTQKSYANNAAVMARIHEGSVATCLYGR